MFQRFQVAQMMSSSSSTVTLSQTCNSTTYFTFTAPSTWFIDFGASNHVTGNKGIYLL